jgi:hypothetical protein
MVSGAVATIIDDEVLTAAWGDAYLVVEIWDPVEAGNPNPGYWTYDYTVENLDFQYLITRLNIGKYDYVTVEEWTVPPDWDFDPHPENFAWDAVSPYPGIPQGETVSGFGIKSEWSPDFMTAQVNGSGRFARGSILAPVLPEPATVGLLGLGGLGLLLRRRR